MRLWQRLYGTVWLAFFACVLLSRWMGSIVGLPVHVLLGLALLILTWTNARSLAARSVPVRVKRISKVAASFAVFQLVSGLGLGAVAHFVPNLHMAGMLLRGAHVVFALAILAQSSSVATAYDMWEEKEFAEVATGQKN